MSEPLSVEVLTEFAENVSYADGEESRAMANELLVLRPRLAALEVERDSLARSLTAERFAALEVEASHLRARVAELEARDTSEAAASSYRAQRDHARAELAALSPRRFEDSAELDAAAPIDAVGLDERGRAWQRVSRWPGDETGCWALANLSMTEPDSSDLLTEHGTITLIHAPKPSDQ